MEMQYLIGTVFRNAQGGGKSKTPDPFTPQREAGDFGRATPADRGAAGDAAADVQDRRRRVKKARGIRHAEPAGREDRPDQRQADLLAVDVARQQDVGYPHALGPVELVGQGVRKTGRRAAYRGVGIRFRPRFAPPPAKPGAARCPPTPTPVVRRTSILRPSAGPGWTRPLEASIVQEAPQI